MENSQTNEKPSTLSVDVEPFIPRQQQSELGCQHMTVSDHGTQQVQPIPPYITTCYPFVQEECVRCDYKNATWSTYVPNVSMQLSFQYPNLDVPSTSFHQMRSYSRYPQSQLSPRYKTGYYARYKPEQQQMQHTGWDFNDKKKNWSTFKIQDTPNYLDLQQQEMYFYQPDDCSRMTMSYEYNNSPRTFHNRAKTNYRKGNKQNAKDNQKDVSASETSSTDLSSQSSSRSHVRTLGDFFSHMKTVKRSKSLPNSAAKVESPRGKTSKSAALATKTANVNIEKCNSEWPSTTSTNNDEKGFKPALETGLTKPKSFADIIKSRPNENKPNSTPSEAWSTGNTDELKMWNKNDDHKNQLKYRCTKANQYFHQPKYYTDISPRCILDAVMPTQFNQTQDNMRCSASLSDIRALKTPRNDLSDSQRKTGVIRTAVDHTSKQKDDKSCAKKIEDRKKNKSSNLSDNIASESSLESTDVSFICDSKSSSNNHGEQKTSTWRYSARYKSASTVKSQNESFVESSIKFSKEKAIYPRYKTQGNKNNSNGNQSTNFYVEPNEGITTTKIKKKKKKNAKEKSQSRKNQLATVQGKMLLLTPEVYSKLFRSPSLQEVRNCDITTSLDNEKEYPELGSEVKETISQLKQQNLSGNEDEEWSDVDSDCDIGDTVVLLSGRSTTSTSSGCPLSYSAALKQAKEDMKEANTSTSSIQQVESEKRIPKKIKNPKKKNLTQILAENTSAKTKPTKPKINAPIQLNISQMLSQFEKKRKTKKAKATFSVNNRTHIKDSRGSKIFPVVANILDSTAPVRRRGKERETPAKKHPSALKKIILREREQRKKLRQLEEEKRKRILSGGSDGEVQDSAWETQGSNSSATPSLCGAEDDQNIALLSSNSVAKSLLHSRRFREYCNHTLNPEIDAVVTRLLQDLIRFHTRLYHKDPVKAKTRRRVVLGLREVTKHLKLKRLKCIILAPNLDRIKSKGGLDDAIDTILTMAKEQNVPYVFALGRKPLGKVCYKQVPVSCVGIFNYAGSENNFNQLMELVARAQDEYRGMLSQVEDNERQTSRASLDEQKSS